MTYFQVPRKKYKKKDIDKKLCLHLEYQAQSYTAVKVSTLHQIMVSSWRLPVSFQCCAIMTTFSTGQSLSGLISLINVRKTGQRVCFLKRYVLSYIFEQITRFSKFLMTISLTDFLGHFVVVLCTSG